MPSKAKHPLPAKNKDAALSLSLSVVLLFLEVCECVCGVGTGGMEYNPKIGIRNELKKITTIEKQKQKTNKYMTNEYLYLLRDDSWHFALVVCQWLDMGLIYEGSVHPEKKQQRKICSNFIKTITIRKKIRTTRTGTEQKMRGKKTEGARQNNTK